MQTQPFHSPAQPPLPQAAQEPREPHSDAAIAHRQTLHAVAQQLETAAQEPQMVEKSRPRVSFTMPNLGVLEPLMFDQKINDIMVNGLQSIYVDRQGKLVDSGLRFSSHEELWQVAENIMEAIDQHWSIERPIIDTRLCDGSRVNMVGPPIAIDGISISIRKFPAHAITLETMVEKQLISPEIASFLANCVIGRQNIVVAGSTSSGKTTMLNALSGAIPADERIVTIEDSAELRLQQPHVVRLEARAARHTDKPGTEVSMRDLVRNALRMRPDRIVLGESRGPEAFDVLQAMNTGHDGSMTTLHANTPRDALSRLETMVMIAVPQLTTKIVRSQIASAVNLVLQLARAKDGTRRVTHISEISGMEGEVVVMQDLVTFNEDPKRGPIEYRWAGGAPRLTPVMEAARASGIMKGMR